MDTLFAQEGIDGITKRIAGLTPQTERQWGKMSVSQMLAHCQKPLEAALDLDLIGSGFKIKVLSALFGKVAKKKFLGPGPIQKNGPTAPSFIIHGERDFETEKSKLIVAIHAFSKKGNDRQLGNRHPFFGEMSYEDWDLLQWRHVDHHLKQFGV